MHSFVFDIETCRQAFNYYDKDKSGALDSGELKELAKLLWYWLPKICSRKHARRFARG